MDYKEAELCISETPLRSIDQSDDSDNHESDDMDTAFIDADEPVENETNKEELNKDKKDFDQVVEKFKDCVREQCNGRILQWDGHSNLLELILGKLWTMTTL